MASTQALSAATQDRKARLAHLKSLKRKQPDTADDYDAASPAPKSPRNDPTSCAADAGPDATPKYLSGRNYDSATKGARLGFEAAPSAGQDTLERQAAALAAETTRQAEEEARADQPLDLFKLQPRKRNWDLKRELDRKLEVLNVRTDNAVARLVRERIARQQEKAAQARSVAAAAVAGGVDGMATGGDVEAAGIEGTTLVEAANVREREDEEEARREREEDEALLDAS